jgi:hypothetical protein
MSLDPKHPHPLTGELRDEGWPKIYIFQNCVNLIEHVAQYQWKKKPPTKEEDAKEQPLEKDDHDVDALGYILMTRPHPATVMEQSEEDFSPAAIYWRRVRERRERGTTVPIHSMLGSEG